MTYAALSQVEAYWHGLSENRAIPPRSAVDPRGIEDALEYAFILEAVAPGIARFRLAGAHLSDLMGMEVHGMPISAIVAPEARNELAELVAAVCDGPEIVEVDLLAGRGIGRPALEARLLLAPLKDDFGTVNRLLGCLQSKGRIGRPPRRLAIAATRRRPAMPDDGKSQHPARTGTTFSEAPGVFLHPAKRKGPDMRPALRLISNDE